MPVKTTTRYITLALILVLAIYLVFLDTMAKPLFEQQASELYGAQVSVSSVNVSPFMGKITLFDVAITDRSDAHRNLAQAARVYVDIDMVELANDVFEIDTLEIEELLVFARRQTAGEILRPLVPADSAIARLGLPSFEIPKADALIEQQRQLLDKDIAELTEAFKRSQAKWQVKFAQLPSEADIASLQAQVDQLVAVGQDASQEERALELAANIQRQLDTMENMRHDFRGDLEQLRELVNTADGLADKHSQALIESLGLSSAQTAQLGSELLRGDFAGLLQQVLAPLAYTADGTIDPAQTDPIHILEGRISGPLIPSAAGLAVKGEIRNFIWPLQIATQVATLSLQGEGIGGGTLTLEAMLDHRATPDDSVTIAMEGVPLRNMPLAGSDKLSLELAQALAALNGEMRLQGDQLSGTFSHRYTAAQFNPQLKPGAGGAARLIATVMEQTQAYSVVVDFSGTVDTPVLAYSSDMDKVIQDTVRDAIADSISTLTGNLQNRISDRVGPELASAREQFAQLEALENQLQETLRRYPRLSR